MDNIITKMKHYLLYFIPVIIAGSSLFAQNVPESFNKHCIKAANRVRQSVVTIIVYNKKKTGNKYTLSKKAYASGTVISYNGIIITNRHVVIKGNFYQVIYNGRELGLHKFRNNKYYIADAKTDLAILKIRGNALQPVVFADSDRLQPGEWVLAIGNPYGLSHSISAGIVSSKGRNNIGFSDIEDFIQTDAAINPGNSGGPLLDLNGKLVGINTAISTNSGGYQGISFAIPSNIVSRVARDLVKYGKVRRGWLGFIAHERGHANKKTITISSVIKGSPADKAGLQKDDIILTVDNKQISSLSLLMTRISNKSINSQVTLSVQRGRKTKIFSVHLHEKEQYKKIQKLLHHIYIRYGFEVENMAQSNQIGISAVSLASIRYGLRRGDIIVSINGEPVSTISQFLNIFNQSGKVISFLEINRKSRYYIIDFIRDFNKK